MVNHTIHTCEQRVRFPLSAIVILFTILPLFSILHHTYTNINLPISIHQTQTKPHHHLYYISVCRYYTLTKPKLYLHLLLPYSLLLLTKYIYTILPITHHYYYYIYTNLQSKYTTILDRYISTSYIHNYYLLTYTENRTHLSIHLFHHTIV